MCRKLLSFTALALSFLIFQVPSSAEVRYPDPKESGIEYFYLFGPDGNTLYGAEKDKTEAFYVEVPKSSQGQVSIAILDADITGKYDERDGDWDTSIKYSVYGGSTLLGSKTTTPQDPDGSRVTFGPFSVDKGEAVGDKSVFKIEIEGVEGNDNNLFAFSVTPDEAKAYVFHPAFRLAEPEGAVMRFYVDVPIGTTAMTAFNYDMDPDGGDGYLIDPAGRMFRVNTSGSGQESETNISVAADAAGNNWVYKIIKATEPKGNMSIRFADQNGKLMRIYLIGEPVRVVKAKAPAPAPSEPIRTCNTFEFDASKSYDPDNQKLTYLWDLGDGTTSDQIRVRHTYANAGTYKVNLTVTDTSTAACRQSSTQTTVNANTPPTALIEVPETACTGSTVRLSAAKSSDSPGEKLSYKWDLGDGATAEGSEVTHTYARGGIYDVKLVVDDGKGTTCSSDATSAKIRINSSPVAKANDEIILCSRSGGGAQSVSFDGSASSDPDGNKLTYIWDFGDGSTGEGARVSHAYAEGGRYTARLSVDDGSGTSCATDATSVPVSINRAPIAMLKDKEITLCSGAAANLSAASSIDADKDTLTYLWDLGDGTDANGATVTHNYSKGGTYKVTVTVDDGKEMSCSASSTAMTVRVNNPPIAALNVAGAECAGRTLSFDASGSGDPDGQAIDYSWDFGDGATAKGAKVSHSYAKGGAYPVTLTVNDGQDTNCSIAVDRGSVKINTPPIADAGQNLVCCKDEVNTFDASDSSDSDGDAISYKWDFGDGATATGATVQHAYNKNGSYQVRVIVSDDSETGCGVASDGFIATVNAAPVADISVKSR